MSDASTSSGLPTTAVDIAAAVNAGAVSAVDVLEAHLAAVDETESEVHAFNAVLADEALAAAAAIEGKFVDIRKWS